MARTRRCNVSNLGEAAKKKKRSRFSDIHLGVEGMQLHHLWILDELGVALHPGEGHRDVHVGVRQHVEYACKINQSTNADELGGIGGESRGDEH
jgi:hypothetical protein